MNTRGPLWKKSPQSAERAVRVRRAGTIIGRAAPDLASSVVQSAVARPLPLLKVSNHRNLDARNLPWNTHPLNVGAVEYICH